MENIELTCPTCQQVLVTVVEKGLYRQLRCSLGHEHFSNRGVFVTDIEFSIYADLTIRNPKAKREKVELEFAPIMNVDSKPVDSASSVELESEPEPEPVKRELQFRIALEEVNEQLVSVPERKRKEKTVPKKSNELPKSVRLAASQSTHIVTEIAPGHRSYIMRG